MTSTSPTAGSSASRTTSATASRPDVVSEEFSERSLAGARFRRVNLTGAAFEQVFLTGARFHEVDMRGVRIRAAYLDDVEINGEVAGMLVNGIDVVPLLEAELDRRHPERAKLRPTDADGFREAWAVIEQLWAGTVNRARRARPVAAARAGRRRVVVHRDVATSGVRHRCLDRRGRCSAIPRRGIRSICRGTRCPRSRALRGRGIASELVRGALELIRADGRKVIAGCGFVVDYLRRNPEFSDLTG